MSDIDWSKEPSVLFYGVDLIKDAAEADDDGAGADLALLQERVGVAGLYQTVLDLAAALKTAVDEREDALIELAERPEPEPSPVDEAHDAHHRYRLAGVDT